LLQIPVYDTCETANDLHQIWFGKQTQVSASIDQTGKNSHHSKSSIRSITTD